MSEFLKRWSARKHQALQQREAQEPDVPLPPSSDPVEGVGPVNSRDSSEVSTDNGAEVLAKTPPPASTKPALPDREALRAMFRSHKPDGLDDYTQDFSQPELLPAALTAGLRHWLVETVTAAEVVPDPVQPSSEQTCSEQTCSDLTPAQAIAEPSPAAAPLSSPATMPPSERAASLSASEAQAHTNGRDILVVCGGQNVPSDDEGVVHQGS